MAISYTRSSIVFDVDSDTNTTLSIEYDKTRIMIYDTARVHYKVRDPDRLVSTDTGRVFVNGVKKNVTLFGASESRVVNREW